MDLGFKTLRELQFKRAKRLFMSVNTIWWTDDEGDLQKGPVPLDIFKSPLLENDHPREAFDEKKIKKHSAYGKYPLTTFAMSHHKNLKKLIDKYNDKFPNKLKDVESYANFSKIVEKLVEDNEILEFE